MARKRSKSPKREAKQQRSKETIEVILTAAGLSIEKYGDQASTTDRIATRAGVSVGTIYQYFNNKDEIFDRFLAREELSVSERLGDVLSSQDQNARMRLGTYIRAGATQKQLSPKVFDELSRVPALEERIRHLSESVIKVTESFIQSIRPDLSAEKNATYAVLLVTTAQGLRTASETGPAETLLASYIEMFERLLLPD